MVKVYVTLIRKGLRTLEDVPERLRADVAVALEGGD
ncbi:MAG: CD1375 family protein [Clostridia bacterium]